VNIASFQTNIPQRALEIYLSGCNRHCSGCHNSQLFDFKQGEPFKPNKFEKYLKEYFETLPQTRWVFILGGEPLQQDKLFELLCIVKKFNRKVLLFTSYETKDFDSFETISLLTRVDCLKTGDFQKDNQTPRHWVFDAELPCLTLATANQQLFNVEISDDGRFTFSLATVL